jgi:hypothetical protein
MRLMESKKVIITPKSLLGFRKITQIFAKDNCVLRKNVEQSSRQVVKNLSLQNKGGDLIIKKGTGHPGRLRVIELFSLLELFIH